MDSRTIELASVLMGILSLVVAVIQTFRLNKLRKLQIHRLRQDLVNCRQAVVESDRLSRRRNEYGINHPAVIGKVRSINANACNLTRSLFEQLSQVDRPYNADRLKQYVKLDIITSKWFWRQAALFVENPSNLEMPDLPDDTPDYMEGAPDYQDDSRRTFDPETSRGTAPNPEPQADGSAVA